MVRIARKLAIKCSVIEVHHRLAGRFLPPFGNGRNRSARLKRAFNINWCRQNR
jgi:hypothetical protein